MMHLALCIFIFFYCRRVQVILHISPPQKTVTVKVLLEFNMGKGDRPDVKQVYSAPVLITNLRQSLAM